MVIRFLWDIDQPDLAFIGTNASLGTGLFSKNPTALGSARGKGGMGNAGDH